MNGKQLRNSILQWAISGRLVPQCPNDEPAIELLKRINPKAAPLAPDDAPFEVPNSWCWVRLGDICSSITDGTHSTPKYTSSGIPFVSVKDMSSGTLDLTKTKYISQDEHDILSKRCNPQKGDILLSKVGTTGIPVLVTTERAFSLFVSVALIKFDLEKIDKNFLVYLIKSPLVQEQAKENTRGVGNKNWVLSAIADTLVVLPPIAEQERIVRKVEELLPLVERYDKAQTELDRLNASLKGKLRASVLQEAIAGRLVPQDPNDEPAIALLRRINPKAAPLSPDDAPFTIPDSWCWCRLGDIVAVRGGKRIPAGEKLTTDDTGHKYIRVTDMKNNTIKNNDIHYINDDIYQKIKAYTISKDDLYITVAGTIGSVGKVPVEFDGANLTENADKLVFSFLSKSFLLYSLLSDIVQSQVKSALTQVGQPKLAIKRIQEFLIPLPPLAEQERVVQKVEELFAVLDALQ